MEAPWALALALVLLSPLAPPSGPSAHAWQIIEYEGPISQAEQAHLRAVVADVLDFTPPFGYLVRLSPEAREELAARSAVVGIRDVPPASKTSADLTPEVERVRILLFPDAEPARVAAELQREGAAAFVVGGSMLDVTLSRVPWTRLAARDDVRWIEPLRDRAMLDNARASSIVQGGTNDAWPIHELGVNGSSQIVAYCDTGLNTDAPQALGVGRTVHEMFADPLVPILQNAPSDLHRKVALYYSPIDAKGLRGDLDDEDGHGTHVAGTLAGDAGSWGARDGNDGVAYAARLAVCDAANDRGFQLLADYSGYWQPAYDAGARVHSNSWGTSPSDEYGLAARQHDAYAWEHRDFLIIRSMGNSGTDGLMRAEAAAKSVLAIGATTNDAENEIVESFSSRGPAGDGRIKPDLVAPGRCVTSAGIASPTAYVCLSGTSQATPAVAGAATLVRDYFAKGLHADGPHDPSSALVRAVLIASAQRVSSAAPDGAEGWGRPQLQDALAFAGDGATLIVHDEETPLATGGAWSTTLDVPAGATLRVVLAWTDHPASPGASPALVNDLDLEVVAPGGAVILGNADLTAADRTNVIERATLTDAAPGTYTLRVRGWNVPTETQPFALVAVVLV